MWGAARRMPPMRTIRFRPHRLPAVLLALLLPAPVLAAANQGAAELHLDRGAVSALLQANLPSRVDVEIPVLGRVTLALSLAEPVTLVDGALDAVLGIELLETTSRGRVALRLVPEIDAEKGTLRFRAQRAQPQGDLAALPDLARLLPPVELPRMFDWLAPASGGGEPTLFSVAVQAVEVGKTRLVIKLGMATRAASPRAPRPAPAPPG